MQVQIQVELGFLKQNKSWKVLVFIIFFTFICKIKVAKFAKNK